MKCKNCGDNITIKLGRRILHKLEHFGVYKNMHEYKYEGQICRTKTCPCGCTNPEPESKTIFNIPEINLKLEKVEK